MTTSTKVSVLLTSYNHAKYLRESIDSILNQTYRDFELHIWDDGSIDNSWEIISSYRDERIRAVRNKPNSFFDCFSDYIARSAFREYIAIHHSDDVWELQKLEKQVAFLDAHPEIGAVFTKVKLIDEDGSPLKDSDHPYYTVFEQTNHTRHQWLNRFFYTGNALCHPSVLIRRACYEECGTYRYGLAQLPDFDMWVRLCLKYEIHVLLENLVRFRIRNNEANTSGNRPEANVRMQFEFLQVYSNYLSITDIDEFLKVFPASSRYLVGEEFDTTFALAMMSLSSPHPFGKLFGLQLLFSLINNPEKAKKIKEVYDFNYRDFTELTAKHDIFSITAVTELTHKLVVMDSQVQEMEKIKNRKVWQTVNILKRLFIWMIPPNSWQAQFLKRISAFIYFQSRNWTAKDDLLLIRKSGLFDEQWYLANNPDVAHSQMDPALHYLLYGGFEARDPSTLFDSDWYLNTYLDVKKTHVNPLMHYLKQGRSNGYQAHFTYKSDN